MTPEPARPTESPDNDVLKAGYEAMFDDKWDGSQAPMMGAGWDAMLAASTARPTSGNPEAKAEALRAMAITLRCSKVIFGGVEQTTLHSRAADGLDEYAAILTASTKDQPHDA